MAAMGVLAHLGGVEDRGLAANNDARERPGELHGRVMMRIEAVMIMIIKAEADKIRRGHI